MSAQSFNDRLSDLKTFIDRYIQNYLLEMEGQLTKPGLKDLFSSMQYSLSGGGNRLRPVLSILTAEALGKSREDVVGLGAAVEFVHTYSLIHDDLPCMDDDDFRRGKPSNHKMYGEAMAVLSGDALVTEAFLLLSRKYSQEPQLALDLIQELSLSSGAYGMVGGQAVDVTLKGREVNSAEIEFLHSFKTGALLRMSVLGAARVCGANAIELKCLSEYARSFGLVFQVADDIADAGEGNSKKAGEPSIVKALGMDAARQTCLQLVERAKQSVEPFGERATGLKQLVEYLYSRVN